MFGFNMGVFLLVLSLTTFFWIIGVVILQTGSEYSFLEVESKLIWVILIVIN